jgi:gamma-glutamyl-gamma-aminobutyrate hydrolase PuuD
MKPTKFCSIEDFGGCDSSFRMFLSWGWESVNNYDDADVIVFNGGADIGTELYGERSAWRGVPEKPSLRDEAEMGIYNEYKGKKFLVGICRGAQFLNAMNGGTLWQHVDNHGRDHMMLDLTTGQVIKVTSTHHQMMRPNLETGIIIGVAAESTLRVADGVTENRDPKKPIITDNKISFDEAQKLIAHSADIEVVSYPGTRTLCIQGHPEYMSADPKFKEWTRALVYECMVGLDPFKRLVPVDVQHIASHI